MTTVTTLIDEDDDEGFYFYGIDDMERGDLVIVCVYRRTAGWFVDFTGGEEPLTTRYCTRQAAVDAASRVAFVQ